MEVELLTLITKKQVDGFIWKNIITHLGIPSVIIIDNGTQLNNVKFNEFYQSYRVQLKFNSINYPQTNGLIEVIN